MTINALSMPLDIPWKRGCVTRDMEDRVVCDATFPLKWRASMAIFTYEPPEQDQLVPDSIVSYVKVSCTITGYQPSPSRDLALPDSPSGFHSGDVTDAFEEMTSSYHACYGALLQVSVGTSKRRDQLLPPGPAPYIADFEPKKRELYELVTETGEIMSRTIEAINVRKGTTTSESTEMVDNFGVSLDYSQTSGVKEAQQPETRVGGQVSMGGGATNINQRQSEDSRTNDVSREARETLSHTTQLTQMYHQLTGYHVGTNRALFFMLPRPHIVQADQTFVKGPRQLEGIQEFFLVVVRPKSWEDFCIEAYLETAHLSEPEQVAAIDTRTWPTKKVTATVEDRDGVFSFGDDSYSTEQIDYDSFPIPAGMTIVDHRQVSVDIVNDGSVDVISDTPTSFAVRLRARAEYIDDQSLDESNKIKNAHAQAIYEVDLDTGKKKTLERSRRMFLTGRRLCCCDDAPRHEREFVSFEKRLDIPELVETPAFRPPRGSAARTMPILAANAMRDRIGSELLGSVNSKRRLPAGLLGFSESEYVAERIRRAMRPIDNMPVRELPGLATHLRDRLERFAHLRRADLLGMSPQEQRDRFHLSDEELVALRRAAIGLIESDAGRREHWDRRRFGGATMPDVRGLDLREARQRLAAAGVEVGRVVQADNVACANRVLDQSPAPGRPLTLQGGPAELTVSTGACVHIPDLAGVRLADALVRLRDAGLRESPAIIGAVDRSQRVRSSEPAAGTWVTPNAPVMLHLVAD